MEKDLLKFKWGNRIFHEDKILKSISKLVDGLNKNFYETETSDVIKEENYGNKKKLEQKESL